MQQACSLLFAINCHTILPRFVVELAYSHGGDTQTRVYFLRHTTINAGSTQALFRRQPAFQFAFSELNNRRIDE